MTKCRVCICSYTKRMRGRANSRFCATKDIAIPIVNTIDRHHAIRNLLPFPTLRKLRLYSLYSTKPSPSTSSPLKPKSQHIEDGLCVDLYDHTNMGSPVSSLPICGETLASSCGTVGDGSVYANNPYNCKKCGTVTIYDNFTYNIQQAQEDSKYQCQGIFTIPEDYGDAYYRNKRLYDAFGKLA